MTMRLLYITRDPVVGRMAERAGVDWIFVDLEYRGKQERQARRDTVISAHTVADVAEMRQALRQAQILVRVNPLGDWSGQEIDDVVSAGADIVMLPFFTTAAEVQRFVALVGGRARTCLLMETMAAVQAVDEILDVPGVDVVHVGLNDLHIERGTRFMFQFLADGSMDALAARFRARGTVFGFGGMARIGDLMPPAERILAEHVRLGSTGVILSRSFCHPSMVAHPSAELEAHFTSGVQAIRATEAELAGRDAAWFERNRLQVQGEVQQVVDAMRPRP